MLDSYINAISVLEGTGSASLLYCLNSTADILLKYVKYGNPADSVV